MSTNAAPTYTGIIEQPEDALILIQACRQGYIPRIRRKLHDSEKLMAVQSGSVFVWVEQESQLHRWTDGRSWSASRGAYGGFLLYREMLKRGGGRARTAGAVEMRRSLKYEGPQQSRFHAHVRSLTGSLLNKGEFEELFARGSSGSIKPHDKFKRGGLVKKTFSLDLPDEKWHLVSYYSLEDAISGCLHSPRDSPLFHGISILNVSADIRRAYFSRHDSTPPSEDSQNVCSTAASEEVQTIATTEAPGVSTMSGPCNISWERFALEKAVYSASSELYYALNPVCL